MEPVNHAPTHDTQQDQDNVESDDAGRGRDHLGDRHGEVGRDDEAMEVSHIDRIGNGKTSSTENVLSIDQDAIARESADDSFQEREFVYNNYSMALVGLAVQNASGQRYSSFIQERILDPLGMDDTIVTRCRMESHQDVAAGYVKLQDNTSSEFATESQTDESHTPILSVIGVRSSVDDMLKLTEAMTAAYSREVDQARGRDQDKVANPLRQLSTIWKSWVEVGDGLSYGMGC